MEESSNGKVEEILREESGGKEKEVVNDDESGAVRVRVVDGKSGSVDENHDGNGWSSSGSSDEEAELKEKSPQVVDSGELEEEKVVEVSVVDLVNHEVPQSEEFNDGEEEVSAVQIKKEVPEDVTELETKLGTEEEVSNETSSVSEEVSNEKSKINEEATLLPSDWNDGVVTEVVSKVIEEVKLPSSEDNGEAPVPVAITEEESKVIEASKQISGESSYAVDVESRGKVEESLSELASSGNVENTTDDNESANKPEISENNGNQPIISLTQRTVQPTSWRSCCGLFEVLRRSDR